MKKLIILTVALSFFAGCAGSKPKPLTNKDLPAWYLNPPKFDDRFVGVGDALRPQFSLSKQVVTERARLEATIVVETTITSVINDHIQLKQMSSSDFN